MTSDKELLCRSWNRDLWLAWREGEITYDEAVFLAWRCEFHARIDWLPEWAQRIALGLYDHFRCPVKTDVWATMTGRDLDPPPEPPGD